MDNEMLLHLQNGSDVRGVAMEMPGEPGVNLTGAAVFRIASAFALWLAKQKGCAATKLRIGVGHDSRLTAETLKGQILSGLGSQGVEAWDCGLASTPAMFMGTVFPETEFDGAIMVTASHLPKNRNGMKFFTAEGGLDKGDITAILTQAADISPDIPLVGTDNQARPCRLLDRYAAFLREKILAGVGGGDQPLAGLHIVVDAGNGSGGFFVGQVLKPLGADCSGSQFIDPDGNFPNHQPNPENKAAMESIRGAVLANQADLGIIFDTDVDRMSAVLANGNDVSRDAIIAMMAAILAPEYPGGTIVTDSVTSDRLTDFLEQALGLKHHCFKRGYRNVINEAIRLNEAGIVAPLAIETSGHGALKENYFLDDGAYMAVRLVIAAAKARDEGKTLASYIEQLDLSGIRREYRLPISGEGFGEYGGDVLKSFKQRVQAQGIRVADSFEGVRLAFPGKGWLLLRMSLHDPLMPLNIEGADEASFQEILDVAAGLLAEYGRLDVERALR